MISLSVLPLYLIVKDEGNAMKFLLLLFIVFIFTPMAQSSIDRHFMTFNAANSQLQSDEVIKVVEDNSGTYWFAEGADAGNDAVYSYRNGIWVRYDASNSPLVGINIRDLIVTPDNRIVIATDRGLYIKDTQTWSVINTSNSNLPADDVTSVAVDKTGKFWIGLLNVGIAVGSGSSFNLFTAANGFPGIEDINFFAIDDSNNVYAGVDYYGLHQYNGVTWKVIIPGGIIPMDMTHVTGGMLDKRNTLWVAINKYPAKGRVASVNDGVVTYFDSTVTGRSYRAMYWSVVTDSYDQPYIGTDKGLLYRINDQWKWIDTSTVPGLPANGFWRGSADKKNNIIYALRNLSVTSGGNHGVVFYNGDSVMVTSLRDIQSPGHNGFNLEQNYPNPFNPSCKIGFSLPVESLVSLEVFDMSGVKITTLVDGRLPAGRYEREFVVSEKTTLGTIASGVYFYRLTANDLSNNIQFTASGKMIFMK